jgi:hypothetical protein
LVLEKLVVEMLVVEKPRPGEPVRVLRKHSELPPEPMTPEPMTPEPMTPEPMTPERPS